MADTAQMQACDQWTIDQLGLPGIVLMECASRAVYQKAFELLGGAAGKNVHIWCGRGNNGGDGFAVARHLKNAGALPQVYLLGEISNLKGDAAANAALFTKLGGVIHEVKKRTPQHLPPDRSDLIIDALLGTGFKGKPHPEFASAIEHINAAGVPVLAVDIPSGVEADTGAASGAVVKAAATITFGLWKRGLLLSPGRELAGEVTVADIGIPPAAVEAQDIRVNLIESLDIELPPRPKTMHKGEAGHVFILAGSPGMTGAAVLTAQSAMSAGAGLVVVGLPQSLNSIFEIKVTEAMSLPLPETTNATLAPEAFDLIIPKLEWAHTIAIGPGLGCSPETAALLKLILEYLRLNHPNKTVVIDADGLNLLSENRELITNLPPQTILTPHPGELARLVQSSSADINRNRIESALDAAKLLKVIVVLKGSPTVTADPEGRAFINPTGNPGMATGGSGDVLTGVIAALAARGTPPLEAAWKGAYLHGEAGDRAAEKKGMAGLLAGDICVLLPEVFKLYEE
ncbi:MAG: NAD(P)H-hydrate dehydratase [Calditrichota bacterium]